MRRLLLPLILALSAACITPGARVEPLEEDRALLARGEHKMVVQRLTQERIRKLRRRYRSQAFLILGQAHLQGERLDRALQTLQLAEGLFPKDINILSELANILYRVGLFDRARPYYERVLKIHPNNANSHLGLGRIYARMGFLAKSQHHYARAIAEPGWDQNAPLWLEYAKLLTDRQNLQDAAFAAQRSLDLSETSGALHTIARIYRRQKRNDEAAVLLNRAVAQAADPIPLILERGLWLIEDGEDEAALRLIEDVLARNTADPLARWMRASILLRQNKTASAKDDLRVAARAERIHPFIARTARAMLAQLESVQ